MDVDINETRNQKAVMQFNDGKAFPWKGGGGGDNAAVGNSDIQILKAAIQKNSPAGQQHIHTRISSSFLFSKKYSTGFYRTCQQFLAPLLGKSRGAGLPALDAERIPW